MTLRVGAGVIVATLAMALGGLGAPSSPLRAQSGGTPGVMRGHFEQALVIHAAVIRGDVSAAAAGARALAEEVARAPKVGSPTALAALLEAAGEVQGATGVLAAAQGTATMLDACGRCHRAARATPLFPAASRPQPDGLAGHMRAHQAAADQLVQGLVVPSDAAWQTGARALATAPLHARELPLDPALHPQLAATEERLHRLATEAVQAADPRRRPAFYAQFLAGCADCHQRHATARKPPRG